MLVWVVTGLAGMASVSGVGREGLDVAVAGWRVRLAGVGVAERLDWPGNREEAGERREAGPVLPVAGLCAIVCRPLGSEARAS